MAVTRLSFSYPEETKERLMELAKKDNRSLSSYVQNILSEHLERHAPEDSKSPDKPNPPKAKRKRSKKAKQTRK